MFVTVIEKLLPLTKHRISKIDDPVVLKGLIHLTSIGWGYRNVAKNRLEQLGSSLALSNEDSNHPFIKTLDKIHSFDRYVDLHEYNLMWRPSTHTVVITDPIA